jgi:phage shock protein A
MEKEINKKDEKIREAQSLYEDSVASAQEEIQSLHQMKENLESSLAQLKEKTSKFFENMHILMNNFSK